MASRGAAWLALALGLVVVAQQRALRRRVNHHYRHLSGETDRARASIKAVGGRVSGIERRLGVSMAPAGTTIESRLDFALDCAHSHGPDVEDATR